MIPLNIINDLNTSSTAQQVVQNNVPTPDPPKDAEPKVDQKLKKRNDDFRARIDICKQYRRKLIRNWIISIDMRRGKPFASQTDEDTINVNMDWSLTKTKQANLFSQVPRIRINHGQETQQPWVASYEKKVNDTLVQAGIEPAMDEVLPDCINAAGIGVVMVSMETITENKEVPVIDPATIPPQFQQEFLQHGTINGQPVETQVVPTPVDRRYVIQRISPSDFLWPLQFTGSNFDSAPWIGRSGRVTWAEGVQLFGLREEDRETILGEDKPFLDRLTHDIEKDKIQPDQMVGFDEIFYKDYHYDPEAKSFYTYRHLVFVNGKDDPVVDEPWKGQRFDEQRGVWIGSMKPPIRVLTLAYITDETIPPSDSAIGRPQVNELNKSRTQMIRQRERSLPVRWFDPNRVDPMIMQALMRGTWQHMIPIQGDGSRAIGEVARAQYPQEDFAFDQVAKRDLAEAWTIGPNQLGSGADVETKGESTEIAQGFSTRIGRERAKVGAFVTSIGEVLGGLISLYEDPQSFGEGFDPAISRSLSYSILADSTVLLDVNQRIQRLDDFINKYAKSGWVSIEPLVKERAALTGLDPNAVVKPPDPKPPVEPNISLRLTGTEDMMNPLTLAFLIKSGQAPEPQLIEQAKALIQKAVLNPVTGQAPQPPMGPDGQPAPPGPPPPPALGEANPQMSAMPQVIKRSEGDQS